MISTIILLLVRDGVLKHIRGQEVLWLSGGSRVPVTPSAALLAAWIAIETHFQFHDENGKWVLFAFNISLKLLERLQRGLQVPHALRRANPAPPMSWKTPSLPSSPCPRKHRVPNIWVELWGPLLQEVPYLKGRLTNTRSCRDWIEGDPERNPRQNHQQSGWHISLQNEIKDTSLEFKLQYQLWIIAWLEKENTYYEKKIKIKSIYSE